MGGPGPSSLYPDIRVEQGGREEEEQEEEEDAGPAQWGGAGKW